MSELFEYLEEPFARKVLYVLLAVVTLFLIAKFSKRLLTKYVSNASTRYQARKLASFITYGLFAIALMIILNYKLSNLTVAFGLAGAGIAFALQEVIVSIAGFLAILSGKFFKVGDRIQLGGIKGDVVDIGILRTTLMQIGDWVDGDLYNGKMVRVSNNFIFKEPVFNYSGDFPFLWDEIKIPIKANSDFEYFREVLKNILNDELGQFAIHSQESWNKLTDQIYIEKAQLTPMVTIAFNENGITFTLRYIVDFKKRRTTKDLLSTKILKAIDASNGRVHIAGASITVSMQEEQPKS
jgi:small-conductance mechanosensitive channel